MIERLVFQSLCRTLTTFMAELLKKITLYVFLPEVVYYHLLARFCRNNILSKNKRK